MIEIPVGKAVVAVEFDGNTKTDRCLCFFQSECIRLIGIVACDKYERKDGKNVIFKLVDYPAKEKRDE